MAYCYYGSGVLALDFGEDEFVVPGPGALDGIKKCFADTGGLTPTAAIERTVVKRQNRPYRSAGETRRAIAAGLTLDQFGLSAGDELVVGRRREFITPTVMGAMGVIASASAIFFSLRHH